MKSKATKQFEYNCNKVTIEFEIDGDTCKAFVVVELPSGVKIYPPLNPYDHSKRIVKLWIDAGMPAANSNFTQELLENYIFMKELCREAKKLKEFPKLNTTG